MNQFFETSDNKFVNLREVASIAFEETNNYKIIFNMNYGVSLKHNKNKMISDYVYSIYKDREQFDDAFFYLMKLVEEYQWIKAKQPRIINPDHISFVTSDVHNNRIILNIASTVSFHGDKDARTSDFVYINCSDEEEFKEKMLYIRESLENLVL